MTTAAPSSVDPFSPRSSTGSSVYSGESNGSCLPTRRIRCSKTQISVGERRYESASDALVAYLTQFEENGAVDTTNDGNTNGNNCLPGLKNSIKDSPCDSKGIHEKQGVLKHAPSSLSSVITSRSGKQKVDSATELLAGKCTGDKQPKILGKGLAGSGLVLAANGIAVAGTKEDVEDLLTSKVTPKLKEEVTDTLREVKLRRLLKQAALKSKNQTKTGLQQEVEAALIRSAELLEKVTREDIPSSKSSVADVSAAGSCNSSILNSELEALVMGYDDAKVEDSDDVRSSASLPTTPRSPAQKSGHIYSYYTPSRQSRSHQRIPKPDFVEPLTTSPSRALPQSQRCAPVSFPRRARPPRRQRASSIDSLLPPPTPTSASLNSTLQLLLNPQDCMQKKDALVSPSSSDSVPSNQSDPTDLLRQIRSRSMSPAASRGYRTSRYSNRLPSYASLSSPSAPDWVHHLDESVRKSVPSWIGETSDSSWIHEGLLEDENNKRPAIVKPASNVPSWVGQAEESDINDEHSCSSIPMLVPMMSTPIHNSIRKRKEVGAHTDSSLPNGNINAITSNNAHDSVNEYSTPGLNFPDLNTSVSRGMNPNTSGSVKHVTFTEDLVEDNSKLQAMLSPASSSFLNKNIASSSVSDLLTNSRRSAKLLESSSTHRSLVLDSDYNGEAVLHNSILPQTARLKKSMDTFKASSENLKRHSPSSSPSSDCSGGSSGASNPSKACSSLDTLALLSGRPMTRSQSHRQRSNTDGHSGVGQTVSDQGSSSDGLDGDRPWERLINTIKSPVPVGDETGDKDMNGKHATNQHLENTLSGGRQPGSMEALKNMLFKLQAEETSTQDDTDKGVKEGADSSQQNASNSSIAIIPALENYDFKQEPGGHSLEKALVHLNRLKKLVKTAPPTSSTPATDDYGKNTTVENASS